MSSIPVYKYVICRCLGHFVWNNHLKITLVVQVLFLHIYISLKLSLFTYLPLDKMDAISQTIFSDAFSWMRTFVFLIKFHWSLFLRLQLTKTSIGLDNGLALNRRQAIIWTNADPVQWHIYTSLGGEELTHGKGMFSYRNRHMICSSGTPKGHRNVLDNTWHSSWVMLRANVASRRLPCVGLRCGITINVYSVLIDDKPITKF